MTDWGTHFAVTHAQNFPDMPPPAARLGPGRLSLDFLFGCGGAAYCVEDMVQDALAMGRLYRVTDAPTFDQRVYAVYRQGGARRTALEEALALLGPAPFTPAPERAAAG
jgi:hypothetical protein